MTRGSVHESSFLIFPSEFESFGLVAAEAMATGLPVVITNRTGPVDYSTYDNSIPIDPHIIQSGLTKMLNTSTRFNPDEIRRGLKEKYGLAKWSEKIQNTFSPFN